MKFTCLSKGGGFNFPPCHILNICGFRILLDAPLDLSALAMFSPLPNSHCSPDSGLIFSEPWYKTVATLHLWDVSLLDVVLISSPVGMLGLPFLTRHNGFSAEIYVTEAAARLGQLMMESLVSTHKEFKQFYGSEESGFHRWMNWDDLDRLPPALKGIALGKDGADFGGWMALYSAVDVKECVDKVRSLRYAEEMCYNGTLIVKALCSGLEIGACNWEIRSPKGDVAFISSSLFSSGHAMEFDYRSLGGNDLILYSDFSFLQNMDCVESVTEPSACSNDSVSLRASALADDYSEESEKLAFVSSCAIDAVKAGGSVLVPINRIGIILQLLEQISASLDSLNLKVPIYFISSVAEELLAFTNVIPEWLCRERQEKMFSGNPLFAHTALVKEKKLQVFSAIHSPELLANWQEPCIVFSPSWGLRLGPAVHLLRRWCGDQNSLLVLENEVDAELALLPYKPVAMKVLQCSFLYGIKLSKVQPLLEILQPKQVLFPDDFKKIYFPKQTPFQVSHYSENETLRVQRLKGSELEIPIDLATQLRFRKLKEEHISVARLKGELIIEHGKRKLIEANTQTDSKDGPVLFWDSPDIDRLLAVLSGMGIRASLEGRSVDVESEDVAVVNVHEPSSAKVQIGTTSSVITSGNENLASSIADALFSILDGV